MRSSGGCGHRTHGKAGDREPVADGNPARPVAAPLGQSLPGLAHRGTRVRNLVARPLQQQVQQVLLGAQARVCACTAICMYHRVMGHMCSHASIPVYGMTMMWELVWYCYAS